ncbi:hypothetical protein [Methanobacterium sp. SMA-27]|uniref:hypothetical protein n=1 Tax=Methanobacterium sp. SMA-27 TaxID=1495336 RepID=UPI00064E9E92|nr:hypothetical protein [Methanobacterium sp. SMA-27]
MKQKKEDVYLKKASIKKHYNNEEVQNIIRSFVDCEGSHKAAKFDNIGLYQHKQDRRRLLDFQNPKDFKFIIRKVDRVLLSTLNHFDVKVFDDWKDKSDSSPGSFQETVYFSLSVDIDLSGENTVHDVKALECLQTAGKFIYQKLSAITGDNVLPLFSGNGIYLHIHPKLVNLPEEYRDIERVNLFDVLTKAFNLYLQNLEFELYESHPEVHGLVKIDAINNKKRFFKTVLSLHRKLPYVVYPIDPVNFQIPMKSIPLSDNDLKEAEQLVNIFVNAEITREDFYPLGQALKEYEEDIKQRKREYVELDIQIPEKAIPIEIIKSEVVTASIMHPDSWDKGNTRRVAYIASLLNLCGWDSATIHNYINGIAIDWHVGAMDHVIDSWIGLHPPNIKTIYNKGSNYPSMSFGDCKMHLPDKPEYRSPLSQICKKATEEGYEVPGHETVEAPAETNSLMTTSEEVPDIEPEPDIKLEYPTMHLNNFDNLVTASDLFGDEYKVIFKALYYQLMSFRIRKSDLQMGRNKADGRINALYPLKAGHGKGEIKRIIKAFIQRSNMVYAEPTSLHAEQLCGKTVKSKNTDNYSFRYGYLARDWLVVDEAFNLLSSNELHYSEARKYIRTALDRFPGNTIHKETTEIGDAAPLEYDPTCPISIFLQPKTFDNDILVLEGDIRRVICVYVNMTGLDKRESYKRNIFDESDNEEALDAFCDYVNGIKTFDTFRATKEAKEVFAELFFDLLDYGFNFNDKIRNFMDIIAYTLQTHLLKFCAVQALQHNRNMIQPADVELAYLDLFEIMHHTYQYVNKKIPGFLNYGEGWQGAEAKDQEVLQWLIDNNAIDESSAVNSNDYKKQIMKIFKVKDRRARDIIKNHHEKGWIERKAKYQKDNKIWIAFKPESLGTVGSWQGSGLATDKDKEYSIKYYYILNNYYTLLDTTKDNPIANCQLDPENDILSEPEPAQTFTSMHIHDSTKIQHLENIQPLTIKSTTTAEINQSGSSGTATEKNPEHIPMIEFDDKPIKVPGETKNDRILCKAYNALSNKPNGIHSMEFTKDIAEVAEVDEYEDLLGVQFQLNHEGYIKYDARSRLITPTEKLLNKFKGNN